LGVTFEDALASCPENNGAAGAIGVTHQANPNTLGPMRLSFYVGPSPMLIFNHEQPLAPEELACLADASLPFIRRIIAGGCPTITGKLSYSTFAIWAGPHVAAVLPEYAVARFPVSGYFSQATQYWVLRPVTEWALHEEDGWLDVGGPGVDGISWALKRGEDGIFAYYPIGGEFVWKAAGAASLLSGWEAGTVKV